ncbi:ECF RNA polymerase sigma-E factor [bacterium HR17]|jgi:RNA polymerase sigma-70 factor (ECF subfamily)|uniref:ECF RNA polymerase sigma-E factor n=1 Tax=Candidatus Fervidibacter japonicus TaxID=2035412 RepID=A0A2H5X9I8_9BACT|nr:ECF RNA polymerase sigma-E factor [bacterium HR17]
MRRRISKRQVDPQSARASEWFLPLSQWSDERLVEAAQKGNEEAFGVLVQRYQSKIFNLALRYTNDAEAAMDVAQDAFVRAWQMLPKFRGDANFYTWLYRIAMNLCIDRHRRALARGEPQKVSLDDLVVERRQLDEGDEDEAWWDEPDASEPEAEVLRREMRQKVWEAVQQLPPPLKQVILLREYEGLSLQEIAKIVRTNVGTVKSRLYQARQHLKRLLAAYFDEGL